MARYQFNRVENIDNPKNVGSFIDAALANDDGKSNVVKIVIGPSPGGLTEGWDLQSLARLSDVEWASFPNLTHLYIWSIAALASLKPLPAGLQCLDVRGCTGLGELPALPEALETLDLGGCTAIETIPSANGYLLTRVHLDDCHAITAVHGSRQLSNLLQRCPGLEELTLSGCRWLKYLELPSEACVYRREDDTGSSPGARLRKLVLRGCSELRDLPPLERFTSLQHLDLNDCTNVSSISGLAVDEKANGMPSGIQAFYTANCSKLREYKPAANSPHLIDIRATHRSQAPMMNVAPQFRVLHELAATVTEFRMAKILILGSGRCGKTTLALALRWHDSSDDLRTRFAGDVNHDPCVRRPSTADISLMQWEVAFGTSPPGAGMLHVWDFGGQEIYHQTHRLFAAEGAIFILAVTTEEEQRTRKEEELRHVTDDVKRLNLTKWNQYREISYWLDYVASVKRLAPKDLGIDSGPSVIVVMTSKDDMTPELIRQAAGYRDALRSQQIRNMHVFVCSRNPVESVSGIRMTIGDLLSRAADEVGIRVPALYREMSNWSEEAAKSPGKVCQWAEWRDVVVEKLGKVRQRCWSERRLDEIATGVAEYLHACGRVFCIRRAGRIDCVVIDQQAIVNKLYSIITPSNQAIRDKVLETTRTPFKDDDLQRITQAIEGVGGFWPTLSSMMDCCDIVVDLGDGRRLAVHPDLLAKLDESEEKKLFRQWQSAVFAHGDRGSTWSNWSAAIHGKPGAVQLGISQFRDVCSWLARGMHGAIPRALWSEGAADPKAARESSDEWNGLIGRRNNFADTCRIWHQGIQVTMFPPSQKHERVSPAIVVRVEWSFHLPADAKLDDPPLFAGGIFLQLLSTRSEEHAKRFLELFVSESGPLADFRGHLSVSDHGSSNVASHQKWCPRGKGQPGWTTKDGPSGPGMKWDVAVSYRRDQREFVEALVTALQADGLHVYHDLEDTRIDPQPGRPQGATLPEIYDHLRRATVLLVVPSTSYFEEPHFDTSNKAQNFYCPVELAEAIQDVHEEKRHPARLLWAAPRGAEPRESLFANTRRVMQQYLACITSNQLLDMGAMADRQRQAVNWIDEGRLRAVFDSTGWGKHNYIDVPWPNCAAGDLEGIVARVRQAIDPR